MRRTIVMLSVLVAVLAGAKPALPWGSAVHAYIDANLGDKGIDRHDMIYGGIAPDTFNMFFSNPSAMSYFTAVSHGLTPAATDSVLALLWNAQTKRETTFAIGWYSHNNVNAADMTAHGYPYNDPNGYVIGKAIVLREILRPYVAGAGITMSEDVFLDVSHFLVEYGADLLMREADRSVGALLVSASSTRSPDFPLLMADTYGPGLAAYLSISETDARNMILTEEEKNRQLMAAYGELLQQGDAEAFDGVSGYLAGLAGAYLAIYGIQADESAVLQIVQGGLQASMALCRDDLMGAVEDTIYQTNAVIAPLR